MGQHQEAVAPQAPLNQYLDGQESRGEVDRGLPGVIDGNDRFAGITLSPGAAADHYNFGERPMSGAPLTGGATAGIGFWHNKNGQALIQALNGSPQSTQLGDWLAMTLPNLYGWGAVYQEPSGAVFDMNLSGKTNAQVAEAYSFLFRRHQSNAVAGGPPKVDAQVMALALATYVTNQQLAGTIAQGYGFQTSADGIAYRKFNVLSVLTASQADALGLTSDVRDPQGGVTILDLLQRTDALSSAGLLYDTDGSGQIDAGGTADAGFELRLRTLANLLFSKINESA